MRFYPIMIWITFVLAGCTTTTDLYRCPDENTRAEVNSAVSGLKVHVNHADGTSVLLDSALLTSNSIAGMEEETGMPVTMSLTEIESFYADDAYNPRGAAVGALVGAASSAATIYLVGSLLIEAEVITLSPFWTGPPDFSPFIEAGICLGALVGLVVGDNLPPERYVLTDLEPAGKPQGTDEHAPSRMVTLQVTSFQDETSDQICVKWNGRLVWLPRSRVTVQHVGEYILLTVPQKLLEGQH